jgi:hypothetical protein
VATTQLVTMNNHEPLTYLDFCLLCCYAAKSTSCRSMTCIYDRESRSLNEYGFGVSDLRDCSIHFIKFFITLPLSLCRSHTEPRRIYRESRVKSQAHGLKKSTAIEKVTYVLNSRIMPYILSKLICIDMILLDYLLQCFLIIAMIDDISRTCEINIVLIFNSLIIFISCF